MSHEACADDHDVVAELDIGQPDRVYRAGEGLPESELRRDAASLEAVVGLDHYVLRVAPNGHPRGDGVTRCEPLDGVADAFDRPADLVPRIPGVIRMACEACEHVELGRTDTARPDPQQDLVGGNRRNRLV